jgi:alanyl-tRNA synthetase
MEQVQWLVNEKIRENVSIHKSEDTYAKAIERGALAFFGDKYDDTVRLIEIANGATFSFEVCGGTHVHRTGELGAVYVLGESSIGSGLRRIEAVSGRGAERVVKDRFSSEAAVATLLNTSVAGVEERVKGLLDELDAARRANDMLERRVSAQSAQGLLDLKRDVDGVTVLATSVEASNVDAMRDMGDWLRDKLGSGVVVLGAVIGGRPALVAMVTPDLVSRGHSASDIVKGAAKAIGGGGGGRPDVAQAGGRRAEGLEEALGMVHQLVAEKAGGH